MSAEVVSPSKLIYTKDFLLRFSKIQKEEIEIAEKLTPILNSPAPANKQSTKNQVNPNSTKKPLSNNGNQQPYRTAKTPNPRKTSTGPVYAQKENIPQQTPSKSLGVESLVSPLRKGILVPRGFGSTVKSPIRKTWVAAVDGSDSAPTFQAVVSSLPTPELKAFSTPVASPNPKTLFSKNGNEPVTPGNHVTFNESVYLSPRSPRSVTGTPFKSPGGTIYSPSKSPRSPARPISPLDEQRLAQRQKQIDYGYRTVGYLRYRLLVAKDQRKPEHPRTPKKTQGCSKRSWDGQLKKWRRDLHLWDPDNVDAFKALLNSDLVVSIIAANPELAEIVDIVREKMDNPNPEHEDGDEAESEFNTINHFVDKRVSPPQNAFIDKKVTPQNGFIEKKVSPRTGGDEVTKVAQPKVARTLVF
jgi:hypothetical protein